MANIKKQIVSPKAAVPAGMASASEEMPAQMDKKKILVIAGVAFVILLLLVFFIGQRQFAGKAIAIKDELLVAGEVGFPLTEDSFMTVGTNEMFPLYVNLGDRTAYVFNLKIVYDPSVVEYKGVDGVKYSELDPPELGKRSGYIKTSGIFFKETISVTDTGEKLILFEGFRLDDPSDSSVVLPSLNSLADETENVLLMTLVFSPIDVANNAVIEVVSNQFSDKTEEAKSFSLGSVPATFSVKPQTEIECGNSKIEGQEECDPGADGNPIFSPGKGSCQEGTTGTVKCNTECKMDYEGCKKPDLSVCKNSQYDYNDDGFVGKKDANFLATEIVTSKNKCPEGKKCDFNQDDEVNTQDIGLFANINKDCIAAVETDPSLEMNYCVLGAMNKGDCVIKFKDPNLEKAVVAQIKLGADKTVTQEDAKLVPKLELYSKDIKQLDGLEFFTELKTIYLYGNKEITDLTPLSGLVNLQDINLWSNKVTNLKPLEKLNKLQALNLRNNQLTDLFPLQSLTELYYLDVRGNGQLSGDCQSSTVIGGTGIPNEDKAAVQTFLNKCLKPTMSCTDSDTGHDAAAYKIAGVVTDNDGKSHNDDCISTFIGKQLKEQYCEGGEQKSETITCADKVSDSTCVTDSGKGACVVQKEIKELLGDTDNNGCLTSIEFNDFQFNWVNNINGIQSTVSSMVFNDLQFDYVNNINGIQCS